MTDIIKLFTSGPKDAFHLNTELIKIGSNVSLTIIDPNKDWTFSESDIYSKSQNSLMLGMKFKGRVELTISGKNAFGYF